MARKITTEYGHADTNWIERSTPLVQFPAAPSGDILIVHSFEVTGQVKSLLTGAIPAEIVVRRYRSDVPLSERNERNAISTYIKPLPGDGRDIEFYREYQPYNKVEGLAEIDGTGFDVSLNIKGKSAHRLYLEVGVSTFTADHFG